MIFALKVVGFICVVLLLIPIAYLSVRKHSDAANDFAKIGNFFACLTHKLLIALVIYLIIALLNV